jgi:hypothetical protein
MNNVSSSSSGRSPRARRPSLVAAAAWLLFSVSAVFASEDSLTTAVYSKVSNGYVRQKMPDGSFERETYAISNGGYSPGVSVDKSIDEVKFPVIAGVVAEHLARQNYYLANDAKSADLLLVIQWGASIPFNDGTYRNATDNLFAAMNQAKLAAGTGSSNLSFNRLNRTNTNAVGDGGAAADSLAGALLEYQMFNSAKDMANEHNANLLGYMHEINSMNDNRRFAGAGTSFDDLISDIENKRYYVIITAYDFRAAAQEKKRKLLWSTRVSIQAQGNRFDERLTTMIVNASKQFGRDSKRLIRQYQQTPRVDLGELKFLAVVPSLSDESRSKEGK